MSACARWWHVLRMVYVFSVIVARVSFIGGNAMCHRGTSVTSTTSSRRRVSSNSTNFSVAKKLKSRLFLSSDALRRVKTGTVNATDQVGQSFDCGFYILSGERFLRDARSSNFAVRFQMFISRDSAHCSNFMPGRHHYDTCMLSSAKRRPSI